MPDQPWKQEVEGRWVPQSPWRRKLLAGVLSAAVLALGYAGFRGWAVPAYRQFKEHRLIAQARFFLSQGDDRNAWLSARQVLDANPRNVEACRIIAALAERARSPARLDWYRRIAELEPTLSNKLHLGAAAMRIQSPPFVLTQQILEELAPQAERLAGYHALAAELALKLGRLDQAAAQFRLAAQLDPTNPLFELNLAVLGLLATNALTASAARDRLEQAATNPALAAVALRWLVADRLTHLDFAAAERFSRRLVDDPHADFDDQLQHLTVLEKARALTFPFYLDDLRRRAVANPAFLHAMSGWMCRHGRAGEALDWLTNCPAQILARQPVPLAVAEAQAVLGDWAGLEKRLLDQRWGELECLRLGHLSRAAFEQNREQAADLCWRGALREAGDRLGLLLALMPQAGSPGREQARDALLWHVAQRFPRERWALRELERQYWAAQNTRGLHRVYSLTTSRDPKNYSALNNLASTSLLLRLHLARAHEIARDLYAERPRDPVVLSTYAYSLHVQGQTEAGLEALEQLDPAALEEPAIALYYGYLLAKAGQKEEAARFLERARSAALLPEEKQLLREVAGGG